MTQVAGLTEVERLKLELLDAKIHIAQVERSALLASISSRGVPAAFATAKSAKPKVAAASAKPKGRGGWPKGKPRKPKAPVEGIAFPSDNATSEAAQ